MSQMMQTDYFGTQIDFSAPLYEPALLPPDSIRWRVYKNQLALAIGGIAAVLLEFAEPRIRSGVWDHSTYKDDPISRSKRTGLVAMLACYGPASTARTVIGQINLKHGKVKGATPSGQSYRALDPVLLDWVAATASYGFLMAYDQFIYPLSDVEKDQFMQEGEAIGREFGARHGPSTIAAFLEMMDKLEPGFEAHPIIFEFLDIVQSPRAAPNIPGFLRRAVARASISLLPAQVRETLGLGSAYDLGRLDRFLLRMAGRAAEKRIDRQSAPCLASQRLGLPHNFLYLAQSEQTRLLSENVFSGQNRMSAA